MTAALPIDAALPRLREALASDGRAVLQAPPGAGKTTRVPLALLPDVAGRIVMLEPRRLAARAAAERMAETLGEPVGQTVGYRMRGDSRVSGQTRIEVVTEGILTRMIQSDPELAGIGAVIFDEFHERSLAADLGLALAMEVRAALRPDLVLLVMSATLDAEPVAAHLGDAPLVTAHGRAFPVDTRWLDRPLARDARLAEAAADLTLRALAEQEGSALVFLPGEGEIRRVAALLEGRVPEGCAIRPLFGAMDIAAQRAAIAPAREGRKVVLATAIAETSLTIEGVRVVVDAGRARRARFDPGSGMARLVTERVTRAEAEQRRGRAGRLGPGVCYRMWTRGEEGALAAFPPPEIEVADLAGLALELAVWGARTADGLPFLTPPPEAAFGEARALLAQLGALDAQGAVTAHGRALAGHPLHPRLAHMLQLAGRPAAPLAALLSDRDPLRGDADVARRLAALKDPGRAPADRRGALRRLAAEARRLAAGAPDAAPRSPGEMLALAYPDRVALRRPGEDPRFLLSGGKGAALDPADGLAGQRLLAVADTDGDPREARIRLAAPLSEAGLRAAFPGQIAWHESCRWSRRAGRVVARRQERFGALVLDDRPWPDAPPEARAAAMLEGVRQLGLSWTPRAARLRARIEAARAQGADLPPSDDDSLLETAEDWLLPHLAGIETAAAWRGFDLAPALLARLDWAARQRLDALAPADFVTPLGRSVPIDYGEAGPEVSVRLQELFGLTRHPEIAGKPLRITLLSPAGRPLQTTTDLPGFWSGAYGDVRKDMRGRYPRHPWPEDPASAAPTLRAKPRGR